MLTVKWQSPKSKQISIAVRKFMQMEMLTPALLNELIEKIEVYSIEGKTLPLNISLHNKKQAQNLLDT